MAISWNKALEIGIEWVDTQHKELIWKIDSLIEAMNEGKGADIIDGLFVFLDGYVIKHFTAEEFYMDKHDYPQREFHKALHKQFINTLTRLKEEARFASHPITLVIKSKRFLLDWLVNHIGEEDKQFGDYLKKPRA